jgi:O-antigen/teichoic acid export membrane protein
MDKQESKLFKNTIIYGIGNFGSKILAYLMVLVYSYYIHSDELGYYDLILTTVSMLQPLIILGINEALYRYMVDSSNLVRSKVVATTYRFIIVAALAASIIFIPVGLYNHIRMWQLILIYELSMILFSCVLETVRGYNQTKLYASEGIANSFVTLVLEFLGLVVLHKGIEVLLISKIIANILCTIWGVIKTNILSALKEHGFDRQLFKELLRYSLPLVPNIICWWVMNSSDRFVIRYYLGASANGIYAIANKFPTILTTITSIFYLAWQESAIKEYSSKNKDAFFSKIFNQYFKVLFSLCALLIPATKVVVTSLISQEYQMAWMYSLPLFIASAFGALCSFLGIGYQISKETLKSFYTTVLAAGINLLVNISLVKVIGLHAASISTLVAYFSLYVVRVFHSKRYYVVAYDWKEELINTILCLFSCLVSIFIQNNIVLVCYCLFIAVLIIRMNLELIKPVIRRFRNNG